MKTGNTEERNYNDCRVKNIKDDFLKCLPIKHRTVLALKYGLTDGISHSIEEIAFEFNCDCKEISRIVNKAQKILG